MNMIVGVRGPELINLPRGADVIPKGALMNRAYSVLTIKSVDDELRIIEGVATTPTTDRTGDVVEPKGAQFSLPLPFLFQHRSSEPIGQVLAAKVTKDGISIKAQIAKGLGIPFIDEAWALIKSGLVRGLSIGFRAIEDPTPIKGTFGLLFEKWEWLELSAVTIPANQDASISVIKSIDQAQMRAASGTARVVSLPGSPPGVTGKQEPIVYGQARKAGTVIWQTSLSPKGTTVKTIKEQIEGFENKRAASDARMAAIMDAAGEEGRTLDATEKEEYDTLSKDVGEVDDHLVRLRQRESQLVKTATPIVSVSGQESETATRLRNGINVVQMGKSNLPLGIRWTRFAMCQAMAKGNLMQAEILSQRFTDTPEVNLACKAAVAAGTTQDATWAAPLVQLQEMQAEFIEFLRPLTFLGRIPGMRSVPFNTAFTRQTSGTTGTFVGEGLPKPLGKMDFDRITLPWAKAATIIVMTQELVRFSNPAAEALARDDLAAGIARFLDVRFIDPQYAGVTGVSPASITNGVTPITATGTGSVSDISTAVEAAFVSMADANLSGDLVWLMRPSTAISLAMKRTSQDIYAYPGINAKGGVFLGYPVITSNNIALGGSPSEAFVVLLDPSEILLADDGQVSIDMSQEASLQMSDTPAAGAASLVSLWQNNLMALRAERYIFWMKRRANAVVVITMDDAAIW